MTDKEQFGQTFLFAIRTQLPQGYTLDKKNLAYVRLIGTRIYEDILKIPEEDRDMEQVQDKIVPVVQGLLNEGLKQADPYRIFIDAGILNEDLTLTEDAKKAE